MLRCAPTHSPLSRRCTLPSAQTASPTLSGQPAVLELQPWEGQETERWREKPGSFSSPSCFRACVSQWCLPCRVPTPTQWSALVPCRRPAPGSGNATPLVPPSTLGTVVILWLLICGCLTMPTSYSSPFQASVSSSPR